MVLWKLRRSRGFRKTLHKVGSRKSPGRLDLLQTSAGGILYPTIPIYRSRRDTEKDSICLFMCLLNQCIKKLRYLFKDS